MGGSLLLVDLTSAAKAACIQEKSRLKPLLQGRVLKAVADLDVLGHELETRSLGLLEQ